MTIKTLLIAVSLIGTLDAIAADETATPKTQFEPPVRLQADGAVIDTGPEWGHSSPCVVDLNQDGLDDLLVGDYSGKFKWYPNVGKAGEPVYGPATTLQAGDSDAEVRIYCCIGAQPRFCDLDGDGLRDMISNSYDPGHCYLFRGLPDGKLAKGEEILDRSGKAVRAKPVQNQNHESFGSFYETVDWENDGDLDLLIGCFEGTLKVRINEGTAQKADFAIDNQSVDAGGQPMKVKAHLCPVAADWDGDGLCDIVAGSDDGSVTWFRNTGSKTSPAFAEGELLVKPNAGSGYNLELWSDADITPGIRSQVEVTDYNGDKKLDLLVGDFRTVYEFRRDLTDKEKQEAKKLIADGQNVGADFGKKMQEMQEDFKKRYPGDKITSDEANQEWSTAYRALRESPEAKKMDEEDEKLAKKLRPFLAKTQRQGDRTFDLAAAHGYVWLYLRK